MDIEGGQKKDLPEGHWSCPKGDKHLLIDDKMTTGGAAQTPATNLHKSSLKSGKSGAKGLMSNSTFS